MNIKDRGREPAEKAVFTAPVSIGGSIDTAAGLWVPVPAGRLGNDSNFDTNAPRGRGGVHFCWVGCIFSAKSFVMRRLSGNKTQGFRRILNSCHLVTEFLVIRSDYGVALFRPRCSVSSLVVWLKLLFPKALQRGHSIFAAVFFRFLIQVNRPVQILFHTQALFI